jgi:membrane-associated protease RseP (regulator of RpoE activity)
MDDIKLIEEQAPQKEPGAKAPSWVWIALVGAVIISLGCGLVFGGAGGFLLGRKGAVGGMGHGLGYDCPMGGMGHGLDYDCPMDESSGSPRWQMPARPRSPQAPELPSMPGIPGNPEQPELRFEFPEMHGGALIVEVMENTPAEQAGLEVGDIIVAVDGKTLDEEYDLVAAIQEREPGDRVSLTLWRGMESAEVEVKLAEHPNKRGAGYLGVSAQTLPNMRGWERMIPQE